MASSSLLKPGEKGKISARINTKGRVGNIYKTVKILSNDPQRAVVKLALKALIKDVDNINVLKDNIRTLQDTKK